MFECMRTEAEMDAFLRTVPGMGPVMNLIQTVRECDATRTNLKRAVCLVELHRAHYVNLNWVIPEPLCAPLTPHQTRVYYAALQGPTDAFMWGTLRCSAFVAKAERLFRVFTSTLSSDVHITTKRIVRAYAAGPLRGLDTEFVKRLIRCIPKKGVIPVRLVRRKRVLGYSVDAASKQTKLNWQT